MYQFILNMWIMRRVDEEDIAYFVTKKYITQEQADKILASPRMPE